MATKQALTFDRLQAELESYGNAVREMYQQRLISSDRVASHDLIDTVTALVRGGDGGTYEVVLSLQGYWKWVEYGTKPHRPPYSKILEWVKIKPVIPRPKNGKLPKPESLAWAITKKIEKEGTEGSGDLTKSVADLYPVYYPKILQALTDDLEDGIRRFLLQTFGSLEADRIAGA